MDKHEQSISISDAPDDQQGPEVSVDVRTGRRIVPTGIKVLSGLVHTSFEPIEPANVIIPYDQ
jgi:hypothetical protein